MQTLSSPPHYTTLSQPIITNNNNNKHFLSLLLTHSKLCSNSISTRRCRYKNSVKHLKQFLWNFREYFFPSSSSHKQQRRQYSKNFMRLCHPNCYRFLLSHHLTSIEFLCINVKREIEKYWDWFSYFPHLFLLDLEFDLVIIHHIIFIEFSAYSSSPSQTSFDLIIVPVIISTWWYFWNEFFRASSSNKRKEEEENANGATSTYWTESYSSWFFGLVFFLCSSSLSLPLAIEFYVFGFFNKCKRGKIVYLQQHQQ